jgi:hypothetical protein
MRAYADSGPQVGRRLSDVKERRDWELAQDAKEQPNRDLLQKMQEYRDQCERDKLDKARRIAEGNARYREAVESEKRVIAARTDEHLLMMMFAQHGASESEVKRVKMIVERKHTERPIELYEVTLLRLRGELAGNVADNQPDWRDSLRRKSNASR